MKINNPHDLLIKSILKDKKMAVDYLQNFLPKEIADKVDFETLTLVETSYINDQLKTYFSDIIYNCRIKSDNLDIEIAILIEHKSYKDKFVVFQILHYLSSAWIQSISNNENPKLIIPILFYHGKEEWKYQEIKDFFITAEDKFLQYVPNYKYIFNNLLELNDNQLWALENQFLAVNMLALKHFFDQIWLESNLVSIFSKLLNNNENLNSKLIVYIFNFVKLKSEKIEELFKDLPNLKKSEVMNTIQLLKKEGKIEGKIEGKKEGKIEAIEEIVISSFKNGIDFNLISNITNLDVEKIQVILLKKNLIKK